MLFFTLDDRMCASVCAPKQMNTINKCGQTYQMSENIIWWNFYSAPRGNANRYELIILRVVHIHEEEKNGRQQPHGHGHTCRDTFRSLFEIKIQAADKNSILIN